MSETFKQLKINGQQVNVGSADRDGEGNIIKDTYARQDGYYTTLGAGTAEQLISTVGITDNDAYRFRTTAGNTSVSDGNAEIKMLRGNTRKFNQRFKELNPTNYTAYQPTYSNVSISNEKLTQAFLSTGSDYRYSVQTTVISGTMVVGHKYLIKFYAQSTIGVTVAIENANNTFGSTNLTANIRKLVSSIFTCSMVNSTFLFKPTTNVGTADNIVYDSFQLFDLTAMSLDSITTVAEFTALYPKSYYPYDLGTLYNPSFSAIKAVGFNSLNL